MTIASREDRRVKKNLPQELSIYERCLWPLRPSTRTKKKPLPVCRAVQGGLARIRALRSAPVLVNVKNRTAVQSNFQSKKKFLCAECERRFDEGGEKNVIRNCFWDNGKFELREQLETRPPSLRNANRRVSFGDLLDEELERRPLCTLHKHNLASRPLNRRERPVLNLVS